MSDSLLQHWGTHPPSRKQVFQALGICLELLSESLPVAMRHVHSEPLNCQISFWDAFHHFNRRTDLVNPMSTDASDLAAIKDKLVDWNEVANLRETIRKGDLK